MHPNTSEYFAQIDTSVVPAAGETSALGPRRARKLWHVPERHEEKLALLLSNPVSVVGLIVVVGWIITAVVAPYVVPFHADAFGVHNNAAIGLEPPSGRHWFGTDQLGRDIFSRVLAGSRTSMTAGLIPIVVSLALGVPLGAVAGFRGGWIASIIMRCADGFLAFPQLLLAIAIAAALGPSLRNAMIAIAAVWWPYYARLVYGQALALKERDFVAAARVLGVSKWRIVWRHVIRNTVSSIIVMFTVDLGFGILTIASLSFVGMGAQDPSPEWGLAISQGRQYLPSSWWLTLFPGAAIFSLVLAFNLIGDGLRDALDPRARK